MHPPDRGFGKPPRNQQDTPAEGQRPLLQGHLKPARQRPTPATPATPPKAGRKPARARPPAK